MLAASPQPFVLGSYSSAVVPPTTSTLPVDGKVLVVGGTTAELYDPSTNGWGDAASMHTARSAHTATLLQSGKVLVAGGSGATAELYDPSSNTWSSTGSMS